MSLLEMRYINCHMWCKPLFDLAIFYNFYIWIEHDVHMLGKKNIEKKRCYYNFTIMDDNIHCFYANNKAKTVIHLLFLSQCLFYCECFFYTTP